MKYKREVEKKTENKYFMTKVQAIRADGRAEISNENMTENTSGYLYKIYSRYLLNIACLQASLQLNCQNSIKENQHFVQVMTLSTGLTM